MLDSWMPLPFMPGSGRMPLSALLLVMVCLQLLLLGACSSPRREPLADDPALRRYADRAYHPERRYAVETLAESWLSSDPAAPGDIPVELSLPREAGSFPLIVYLPGLGESADAGQSWRKAWAAAGYAVLVLQPKRFGPAAMQGRYAKSADFTALARENYATAALNERLRAVDSILSILEQRIASGVAPYDRIDSRRLVVAGFDLGAQTVQALAGERVPGVVLPSFKYPLQAAIILSPYANAAGGGFAKRFSAIGLPVFAATATEDSDSFGVVTSLAARLAPYNYMPAGDKYLLLLSGGSHRLLAGSGSVAEKAEADQAGPGGEGGGARRGGGGGMPPGGGGGGRGGPGGGMGGAGGNSAGSMSAFPVASNARQTIAIQGVSLTFLDATLKTDPVAREWLERDAGRWLESVGELRRK